MRFAFIETVRFAYMIVQGFTSPATTKTPCPKPYLNPKVFEGHTILTKGSPIEEGFVG